MWQVVRQRRGWKEPKRAQTIMDWGAHALAGAGSSWPDARRALRGNAESGNCGAVDLVRGVRPGLERRFWHAGLADLAGQFSLHHLVGLAVSSGATSAGDRASVS